MIEIYIDTPNSQVRRMPAFEARVRPESDCDYVVEIELAEELFVQLPEDGAEDLYNALAVYFAGDTRDDDSAEFAS